MVEALGIVIIGAAIIMFGVVALPILLHDSDTGASFFDQLFDVDVGNATDGDGVIFINGTWINANVNFTGGGGGVGGFPWNLYKIITINASEVDEDITLYPHSLDIIDTDLRDHAQTSGDDIIFTDITGTTQIPHEIEFYNSTNGHLTAWVGVANVSSTIDTSYRMWYNSATTTNTEDPAGVWDSNYIAVWHLGDNDFTDSTGGNDGTNTGSLDTVGQIDGAREFLTQPLSWIDVGGNEADFDNKDNWTISTWTNRNDTFGSNQALDITLRGWGVLFGKMTDGEFDDGYSMYQFNEQDSVCAYAVSYLIDDICFDPPTQFDFTHIVATFNSTQLILYSNGTQVNSTTVTGTTVANNNQARIGQTAYSDFVDDWNGEIDEMRISSLARSSEYISTTHCDMEGFSFCPFEAVSSEFTGSFGGDTGGGTGGDDNTERLYSHLAQGTAGDIVLTFGTEPTEYQIRFHDFEAGTGMGAADHYVSWYSVAQLGFNADSDLGFEYYYTTDSVGNAEPFCMIVRIWEFEAQGGDLDDTVQTSQAFCDYTPPTPDILEQALLVFPSSDHNIDPADFVIFNLAREGDSNATDTGNYDVYASDPRITWNLP